MADKKTLKFSDYDAYGFDIDHTLAKYNLPNLFNQSFQALSSYLVNEKGYDAYLAEPFDKDFCTRGLVLDIEKGNFMKLGEDGTVIRASHGTRMLTDEEIIEEYGEDRHWRHFEELIDSVNNLESCRIFENFFDMPGSVLCARMVDLADREAGGRAKSYHFWSDVIDAYNDVYLYTQFAAEKGGYFPSYKKETSRFLHPCSDSVKEWLKTLRQANKKVFVMTSAYVDCAKLTMQHSLGDDWHKYFDLFLKYARKPGFFTKDRPFYSVENDAEKEKVTELKEGETYAQGNLKELMAFLSKATGKENPKVLFFGDSLRSDVFPSKMFANWDTVMILEEMEAEIGTACKERTDTETSEQTGSPTKKQKVTGPPQLEREYLTSSQWGSLFTDDFQAKNQPADNSRYMNTLWGYMIRKYADVAIPQLEYITDWPLDHPFTVFNHEEKRKWGFYPRIPAALQD